jgi:hypothetical protein
MTEPLARREHNCPDCGHFVPTHGNELIRVFLNGHTVWDRAWLASRRSYDLRPGDRLNYEFGPISAATDD